ncbi:MAG: hypothetical protein RQ722_09375 [Desulfuromonadales bacterium]|nr:hypothetical protein [Desulfuromonadales bacterium]
MNRAKIRFITLCCLSFGLVLLLALSACNQAESVTIAESGATIDQGLPKLADVDADKCIPCSISTGMNVPAAPSGSSGSVVCW